MKKINKNQYKLVFIIDDNLSEEYNLLKEIGDCIPDFFNVAKVEFQNKNENNSIKMSSLISFNVFDSYDGIKLNFNIKLYLNDCKKCPRCLRYKKKAFDENKICLDCSGYINRNNLSIEQKNI